MRILHVLRSDSWGGLEHYTVDWIQNLESSEVKNTLLTIKDSRLYSEAKSRKISATHHLRALWYKYDVIHVHQRKDLPLVRFSLLCRPKIKFVYTLMMNAPNKKDLYHRWIYSRLDALFSSSELLNEQVKKNFPISADKVHLIPYGRPPPAERLSLQQRMEFKKTVGAAENKMIFGTLCRIDPGKGVGELAEAIQYLTPEEKNKIEIWLIGEPTILKSSSVGESIYEPQSLALYEKLKKLDPSIVRLIPYQKNPLSALSAMDIFVLASHHETYSLAVLDAMMLGLPVAGSRSGGTIEQIGLGEERGHFFEPKNSKSIADAIRFYLSHSTIISQQGERAKAWCRQRHSWERAGKIFLDLI